MSLEDELRNAIALRNEMAVALAASLLSLTTDYGLGPSDISDHGIVGGNYSKIATDIEALTAVILQRCGASWDTMASRADMSRQALHRRLSARGEELFDDAVNDVLNDREFDTKLLIKALRRAERIGNLDGRVGALSDLPTKTRSLIEAIIGIPSREEILTAPDWLASNLAELRQTPQWWDWEEEED